MLTIIMIIILIPVFLTIGYIYRIQAGKRVKPDILEVFLCLLTGIVIFSIVAVIVWLR